MLPYLNNSLAELSVIFSTATAGDAAEIKSILDVIKNKKPAIILKKLEKSGGLVAYVDYYERQKNNTLKKIAAELKERGKQKPVSEVLIDIYLLNKDSNINWPSKSLNITYAPRTIQPSKTDHDLAIELLNNRVTRRGGLSLPEFSETCIVTAGPKKGERLSLENAPYARRPFELMDSGHECQLCVLMWASQSMKSVSGQIMAVYYSKEVPSEILYAMADLAGMRKTMNRRLTPLLEDIGVQFITQSETKGSRKTGDTTFSKEFAGGNLDGITANSSAALASETKRIFIADELGNWKAEIGDQGNPFYQGWARLKAWQDEKKCIIPSTPTDEENCMVYHLFKTGTMEEWFVPCPLCGAFQMLEVQNGNGYGLNWDTRRGRVSEASIVYVCKSCSGSFTEKRKFEIQQSGEWRIPVGHEPIDRYTYSLHLHSINSAFESWREIASSYERGRDDPAARKYYDNHVSGLPHKTIGKKIDSKAILNNRGDYQRGTVPD